MFWEIALPVLAAIAQGLTGFLGWRVTVDGVSPKRKKLYEWLFVLASLTGIIAVGVAAHRSVDLIGELHGKMHVDGFRFLLPLRICQHTRYISYRTSACGRSDGYE